MSIRNIPRLLLLQVLLIMKYNISDICYKIMNLVLTQWKHENGVPCCDYSFFNKGELLPRAKCSEHDYGFMNFDCKWHFSLGVEGPVSVINHRELRIKHKLDKEWFSLTSKGHYFKNNQFHYPFCHNDSTFVVMSLKPNTTIENKNWDYFLWILKRENEKWSVMKTIELEEWFRPLQFTPDESKLIVWGYLHISSIDLATYAVETIIKPRSKDEYYTFGHLSTNGEFVLTTEQENESKMVYCLAELSTKNHVYLNDGENEVEENFKIPEKLEFSLFVGSGSSRVTISKK